MATDGMNLKNLYQNEYSFEETINENLFKIESFETLSIKSKIISSTDNDVVAKELYLIAENQDELFKDKVNQVACYNNNLGWLFYKPKRGNIAYLKNEEKFIYYNGSIWDNLILPSGENNDNEGQEGFDATDLLKKYNNLGDLLDVGEARNNLNVYSKNEVYGKEENYSKEEVYSKTEIDSKFSELPVDIFNITDGGSVDTSNCLKKNNNLSDLNDVETARNNLNVYAKDEVYSKDEVDEKIANIDTSGGGVENVDTSNCLKTTNNLGDLSNIATARTNLNVYSQSEVNSKITAINTSITTLTKNTFDKSKNLKDITDQDTVCHNIGTLRDWEIRRCGDYKISAVSYDHDNWYICDGRELSRANYPELFKVIGTTCGAGNGTTTFNLPNFKDKTIWGANGNLNQTKTSGLPNITGSFCLSDGAYWFSPVASSTWKDGAFYGTSGGWTYAPQYKQNTNGEKTGQLGFDASKSNNIYGKSAIVQPPAICVNIFICVR